MEFRELARINGGYAEARILQTAVTLGLFDRLDAGGRSAAAIAADAATDPRATELLLNALVAMRLVRKHGDLFHDTEVSRTYLTDASPASYGDFVRFDASLWSLWGNLAETVRTGRPARDPDMFQSSPEDTAGFIDAMASIVNARGDARVLAETLDLRGVRRFLDVGAGPGTYAIALCRQHPELRATIFDLPGTLAVTRRHVDASGLADRIELVAGDYLRDPLPGGHELVFLSNVIHGEDADTNRALMRKISEALPAGGRVMIKDHVTDESGTSPAPAAIFSIAMLLFTRGRDYAFAEIREWLLAAGFAHVEADVLPPGLISTLVVGRK
jgi:SAM-dependent methyltransferase